jgi:hypothetical protein
MQSDPWWSFAMAVNVFMVFFFAANPRSFLRYWWVYFLVCYGIPFIPSLWLLLVRDEQQGLVYGDATVRFVLSFGLQTEVANPVSSSGAGSTSDGAGCAYTPIISQYGYASFFQRSYMRLSGSMSFSNGTSCGTCH